MYLSGSRWSLSPSEAKMCAGACDMRTLASAAGRASICACDRPVGASVHPSSTTPASRTASKATAAPDHVLPDTASACTSAADCPPPARSLAGTGRTSAALEKSSRLTVVLFDLAPVARRSRMRRGGRSGGTMGQVVAASARTSGWTLPPAGPGGACGRLRFAGPPQQTGAPPPAPMGFRRSTRMADRACSGRSTATLIAGSTRQALTRSAPSQVLPLRRPRTRLDAGSARSPNAWPGRR